MLRLSLLYFFLSVSCFHFISCAVKSAEQPVLAALDSSIRESNKMIALSNENLHYALENRIADPVTKEIAAKWLPKTEDISRLSKEQFDYLQTLKSRLTEESAQDKSIAKFFADDSEASKLYRRLNNYWINVLQVDTTIGIEIGNEIRHLNVLPKKITNQRELVNYYFAEEDLPTAIAMLSKFQNNVLQTENRCLLFCMGKAARRPMCDFPGIEAIVAQNAKVLKAGDVLEITAGIGEFRRYLLPKITVGNKVVELNDKAIALYKQKTPLRKGNYSLPVKVEFTDQDGKSQERVFRVEYTVVDNMGRQ